jgi:hypothetical protein
MAIVLTAVGKRRMRKAARSFACVVCAKPLGNIAVKLADDAVAEQARQWRRTHPYAKYRMVRTLRAICPVCGTRYAYDEADRTFLREEEFIARFRSPSH